MKLYGQLLLYQSFLLLTSRISLISPCFLGHLKFLWLYLIDGRILSASVSYATKPDFELYLVGGRILYASVSSRRADTVFHLMFLHLLSMILPTLATIYRIRSPTRYARI